MAIVVIGGHSSNIGKTGVVCALISAMPERRWTAIKISRHDQSEFSEPRGIQIADHAISLSEERDPTGHTDSSRFLAAGAVRSFWVRTRESGLAEAMPHIRVAIAGAEDAILESNSILGFLEPDVYAAVLDPKVADFKTSSLQYLGRANAFLVCGEMVGPPVWRGVPLHLMEHTPRFQIAPPDYCSAEFNSFVARRLERAGR